MVSLSHLVSERHLAWCDPNQEKTFFLADSRAAERKLDGSAPQRREPPRRNAEFFRRLPNSRFFERLVSVKGAARRGPPSAAIVFILEEKHSAAVRIDDEQTSGSPRHWFQSKLLDYACSI
jgi:hypothetical protein